MSVDPARSRAKGRARRWRRVLLGAVLATGLALAAWAVRNAWLAPLALRVVRGRMARDAGLALEVGATGGSWTRDLVLERVRLGPVDGAGPVDLRADRIEIRYRLGELLRDGASAIERVEARGLTASIDLTQAAPSGGGAPLGLPARLPEIALADASIELRLDERRSLALSALDVRGARAGSALALDLAAGEARWTLGDRAGSSHALEAALLYDAGRVAVERLSAGGRQLAARSSIDLARLGEDRIAFDLALLEGRARLRGDYAAGAVEADVDLDGLVPSDVADALGALGWTVDELPIGGRITLDGRVRVPLDAPEALDAAFAIQPSEIAIAGRALTDVALQARVAGGRIAASAVSASAGDNRLRDGAIDAPLTAASLAEWLAATRGRASLELRDVPALAAPLSDLDVPRHAVLLSAELADATIDVAGLVESAGGRIVVEHGRLSIAQLLAGLGRTEDAGGDRAPFELDLVLQQDDLCELGALLGDPDWSGRLAGQVAISGTWREPSGVVRLRGEDVRAHGAALGAIDVAADLDREAVRVESLRLEGERGALSVAGSWRIDPGRVDGARIEARTDDVARFLGAEPPAGTRSGARSGGAPALAGPATLVVRADGPLDALALELAGEAAFAEVAASGVLRVRTAERAADLALGALEIAHAGESLRLVRRVDVAATEDSLAFTGLELAGASGGATAALALGPERLDVDLAFARFSPPAFLSALLPAALPPGTVDGRLALADGRATLERLRVEHASGAGLDLDGSLPLDPLADEPLAEGPLDVRGSLRGVDLAALAADRFQVPLQGRVEADLALGGSWSRVEGDLALRADDVRAGALGPSTAAVTFRLGPDVAFEEGRIDAPSGIRVRASGRLGLACDVRALLRGRARLADAPLDVRLSASVPDLAPLASLVPHVRRIGGAVAVEADVAGTLSAPRFGGRLDLENGLLRTETALPTIGALELGLRLEGDVLRCDEARGELGGAPVRLSGELAPFGDEPTIDVALEGEDLLVYRSPGVRVRADGRLRVSGPLASPLVSGELGLRDGRYVEDFEIFGGGRRRAPRGLRGFQLFSLREPPFSRMRFDVAIHSATPFEIQNNLTTLALRPEGHLEGSGETPILHGAIYFDPGRVALPSGTLRVLSGTMRFDRSNPFLPDLDLRGEMRVAGYDLRVGVSGPYDAPEIELASVPSLPQDELLLLFLTGAAPGSRLSSSQTQREVAQDVAVYLAKDFFARLGSSSIDDEESFLERIEVTTGADITRSGSQTTRGTLRVAEGVFRDHDAIYVTGEKDVYDKVNYGLRFVLRLP